MNVGEKNIHSQKHVQSKKCLPIPLYKGMFAILPILAQPVFNETPPLLNTTMANSTLPRIPRDSPSASHFQLKDPIKKCLRK